MSFFIIRLYINACRILSFLFITQLLNYILQDESRKHRKKIEKILIK